MKSCASCLKPPPWTFSWHCRTLAFLKSESLTLSLWKLFFSMCQVCLAGSLPASCPLVLFTSCRHINSGMLWPASVAMVRYQYIHTLWWWWWHCARMCESVRVRLGRSTVAYCPLQHTKEIVTVEMCVLLLDPPKLLSTTNHHIPHHSTPVQ